MIDSIPSTANIVNANYKRSNSLLVPSKLVKKETKLIKSEQKKKEEVSSNSKGGAGVNNSSESSDNDKSFWVTALLNF